LALGKTVEMGDERPRVVGVLPVAFRFPSGRERVWIPLDLSALQANHLVSTLARMAPGQPLESVSSAVVNRAPAVLTRSSPPWNRMKPSEQVRMFGATTVDPLLTRLFILLCAAAGCLLVVACANVVNLELAATLVRARLHAVELALGASRSSLLRVALLEGVAGLMAATALGAALAYAATDWVWQNLPARVTTPLVNGVDVDARALGFMAAVATLIWLLTSLPVAIAVARANVLDTLKRDTRTLSVSRSSRLVRQWLTAGQIAVTVVLLTGALLSAQSYAALLAIPKGFDTAGVVAIGIQQKPGDSETAVDLHARLMAHLQARKDAMAVSAVGASPPATAGAIGGPLTIVGRPEPLGAAMLGIYEADPNYFGKTMRLPLLAGREFQPGDPMSAVIVDEAFAARYWPGGDAVGARFRVGTAGWPGAMDGFHIIGVAAHLRTFRDSLSAPSDEFFPVYKQLEDPSLTFAVRLQNERNITDLTSMVRALVPGAIVSVQTVRNRYAALFGNELLAASIMSAFGVFAFLVAMVGIYGVMAFLVAAREREIGIRLAIGASQGAIIRLVLASSARLIIAGVAIGGAAAFAAAQWAGSLLFGVAFDSPWTYTIVAAAVIIAGLLATWQPARKAGRVDPIIALRAE
jgi:predicted permease